MGNAVSACKGGVLFIAASATLAPAAHAGAWSLPAGDQQWVASVSRESGDFGQAWRADDFNELGVGDGWSLTSKVETQVRIGDVFDDRSGFRIGLQKAFPIGERGSIAFQVSALGGESLDGVECEGGGYEVRAAAGTSFAWMGREGFVNVEVGNRTREDCSRTVYEVATGLEFATDWNLGLKAWLDGVGDGGSAKAEVNVSHDFWGVDVGVGWRKEISGNFKESGWVVSAGTKF